MKISVVVCTFNRSPLLRKTLDSLLAQGPALSFPFEIIIVDNNSTDETKQTALEYAGHAPQLIKYAFERRQGLSYARNRAVSEATGDVVAFLDDDVVAHPAWLTNLASCFKNDRPDAVGGRILPVYPEKTPGWVKVNQELLNGPIVFHDYGEAVRSYEENDMRPFVGANFALRAELFKQYGTFRVDIGAGQGSIGEDTEFFYRLNEAGKKILYCGRALVWHPVEKKRMTLQYIAQWKQQAARFYVIRHRREFDQFKLFLGFPRYLLLELLGRALAVFLNVFRQDRFLKSWIKFNYTLGVITTFLDLKTKK